MELEKIRAADTSVRWQDDEDVDNCPSCKTNFTVTRRKVLTFVSVIFSSCEPRHNVENDHFSCSIIAVIVEQYIVKNA